jgi:hypothetical protein
MGGRRRAPLEIVGPRDPDQFQGRLVDLDDVEIGPIRSPSPLWAMAFSQARWKRAAAAMMAFSPRGMAEVSPG